MNADDIHVNVSIPKYVYLVMFKVQMSLFWALFQLLEFFFRGGVKKVLFEQGVDRLIVAKHLPYVHFLSHRFVHNHLDLCRPLLLFHITFDLYKNLVPIHVYVSKYMCYPLPILYTYILSLLVFYCYCILHVICCRAITLLANVTGWLYPTLNKIHLILSCLVASRLVSSYLILSTLTHTCSTTGRWV